MISNESSPLHKSLALPRPAHRASILALPSASLADVATTSAEELGAACGRYCSGLHADDSIAPSAFGPVARWGRVTPGGAA